ncbi:MAG: hypothetical protein ACI9DF_005259 [Verrucomicrobiales bacterium]|jgi:hypothetical protein
MFTKVKIHLVAGALVGAFSGTGVALAQDAVDEKAPHVQIIEELDQDLNAALLENDQLKAMVKNLSSANRVLAENTSAATVELEELRETNKKALLHLELFSGVLDREESLVKAASDLRLLQRDKERASQAFMSLLTAMKEFMKVATSEDANARRAVEKAGREGEEALGLILQDDQLEVKTLDEARVITVNKEYNLVLVDAGQQQGLRVGTPISLHRKDRVVGTALIINVRDAFSGAILLELSDPNDQIMIGDGMKIDPEGV